MFLFGSYWGVKMNSIKDDEAEDVEIEVQEVETQLALRDKSTNSIIAKITVGQLIPYAGIWLRVVKVATDEVTLRPEAYTGKRIKKLLKKGN